MYYSSDQILFLNSVDCCYFTSHFCFSLILFQKNSPYIEEVSNHLYDLVELGFFDVWRSESIPYASKCDTLAEKLDSKQEKITVLNMSYLGSTFVLTVVGLLVGVIMLLVEFALKGFKFK